MRRLWRLWRTRLLLDRGLRGLLGVCRMCSRLVGLRAAAGAFLSGGAGQAAIDTAEAAAQGRRKACRNAVHQFGAPHAGPSTRCTGDARADDHTRDVAFASRGRAGIDPGLIDTEPASSQDQSQRPEAQTKTQPISESRLLLALIASPRKSRCAGNGRKPMLASAQQGNRLPRIASNPARSS